ncbi:MAG: peptidyl-prolyl cis-trans isomerase [Lachnospiraceae bacterium]|nr:peptidyl-prolyl cis-trans isomerase [Lachnospiraceae bacterium]
MKKRFRNKCILILTAAAILLTAVSCGSLRIRFSDAERAVFTCDSVTLNHQEVSLIAAHYASLFNLYYSDLAGEDFWERKAGGDMTYEQYVLQYYVQDECRALAALNALSERGNGRIPTADMERLEDAAAKTYAAMTEEEKAWTGAGEKDVLSLLTKYHVAQQMIAEMLAGEKVGISEEASRVADIQVIRMTDRLDAEDVYNRILRNENFLTLARAFSVDETIDYSVSKSDLEEPFNTVVFAMAEGDVSELIELDGSFYIIRLTNSYNTLLSMKNGANLLAQQKYDFWSEDLEVFMQDHPVGVVRQNFSDILPSTFTEKETFALFRYFN